MSSCAVWTGLAWLVAARFAVARADCVELAGQLPPALVGCATERRVCESLVRAIAADGGDTALAAALPVQVQLRSGPGPEADPTTLAIDLDASTAGRWLGHRSLSVRARDCAALPDALALVLVLLAREASPSQPTAAVEPAQPQPPTAASPEPRPRARRGTGSVELGAGAGVFWAALPTAALGLHIHASTLARPVALRLRASFLWPQEQRVVEGYVQMRDYELAIEACSGLTFRNGLRLALRVCAGPRVGLVHARAREFALQNEHATELALYLGLMPEVSLAVGSATWLRFGAAGAVALIRPHFGVGLDDGQRWTPLASPHWLRAELSLSLAQIF